MKTIRDIIKPVLDLTKYRVFVFGSRADGMASRYSDFDIGIEGEKLSPIDYFNLTLEFEESDLPYCVDIVEFCDVSEEFKAAAKKHITNIA
ncbi:MAG: nucleotidyltransferase domain-containing protein [Candidatus Dadabacteria bacterium]|nr:MAG: nucleotidyltransferase domain-containing protein [Candidatus Dadabacteria bacterium]